MRCAHDDNGVFVLDLLSASETDDTAEGILFTSRSASLDPRVCCVTEKKGSTVRAYHSVDCFNGTLAPKSNVVFFRLPLNVPLAGEVGFDPVGSRQQTVFSWG